MRVEFTRPAEGEQYLVDRKAAERIVRAGLADLEVLSFQTRHGPKMTEGLPYCATYSSRFLRVLSVGKPLATASMGAAFVEQVLPWVIKRIAEFQATQYTWPCVVVALDGKFVEATCSEGAVFPSLDEVRAALRRRPGFICQY